MSFMKIKKGDYVEVIDDSIIGKVLRFNDKEIAILTVDGFELTVQPDEVIPFKKEGFSVANYEVASVLAEKERPKRKQRPVAPKKQRNEPRMEVDLHIHQLVKSTKGMGNYDMLNLQLETAEHKLNYAIKNRIQKIVFIHGVGEGVLKTELEYLFGRYDNVKYYDADYSKYGLGATEVYIFQNA